MECGIEPSRVFVEHYGPVLGYLVSNRDIFFYAGNAVLAEPFLDMDLLDEHLLLFGELFSPAQFLVYSGLF